MRRKFDSYIRSTFTTLLASKPRIILLSAAAVWIGMSTTFVTSEPAHAGTGLRDDRNAALIVGADKHRDDQGTYSIGLMTPPCVEADNTWEWVIGSGITCSNVTGISATGLLGAYEQIPDPDYLLGAELAGDELVLIYDGTSDRPFAQDVEFLVRLSQLTGDATYYDKAVLYYGRVLMDFTATANVDRHIDGGRNSLSGWDIASHIRAAIATGYVPYAEEMAARLFARRLDWEGIPCCGGFDATMLSHGSLLWALGELNDKSFRDYVSEISDGLLAAQAIDGSWFGGDFQTTAYVLLGLGT